MSNKGKPDNPSDSSDCSIVDDREEGTQPLDSELRRSLLEAMRSEVDRLTSVVEELELNIKIAQAALKGSRNDHN